MLLSSAYFPNVHYFTKVLDASLVSIEAHDHYQKQSFRNRCQISSANGVINLIVPVVNGRSPKLPMRDVRIDYAMAWQKNHLKSIESAYRHSPFYEFLLDDLIQFFDHKEKYLLDFNTKIITTLINLIGLNASCELTSEYRAESTMSEDWREQIHPKVTPESDATFAPASYPQNFDQKNGFQPNLSILDTLFQLGPETQKYLQDCILEP